MRTSTFRLTPLDTLGLLFLGGTGGRGQGTRDRGQWEQVEVRDTTSNTLDSIGHTPLGFIFFGEDRGPGTGDREKDTTFYDPLLSTLWGQGGQDLDALEKE